ncbi:type II toxin-antitoxin system RelE/ParE family toxin [Pasteurellaceae bacterium USgator11]|nr:type II toxin-antitoxin system RelE/ParE family toxin [Pasteurellaceae bacterium USgator41]TNG95089.1 type II toxin-antitoxin system RelE/ParE family toxin [Pasteurellaceae bacterium UScroc12]TNG99090.1 type II toxin-antitoxin system RelE/ParE family toxin [Pasteurellaceae bacterium USgator11]TNG99943.1 type II toxin-antitoxin system RelE/ParE family toxin [Pasteurellaceae bacterium UScroc31]
MYKLSALARRDFLSILDYTEEYFGVAQADSYGESLAKTLNTLAASPFIGKKYAVLTGKILMCFPHQQHTIFYRVRKNDIFVVRILHQQMETKLHISYN